MKGQELNRRRFIGAGGIAAAAAASVLLETSGHAAETGEQAPAPAGAAPVVAEPFRLVSAPVLQSVTADRATVFWAVNGRSTGWVEYGTAPDALTQKSDAQDAGLRPLESISHKIRLSGLKPGTRYHYRIASCPVQFRDAYHIEKGAPVYSPVYTFTTLGGEAVPTVTFSVLNDTHERADTLQKLMPQMIGGKPDLLFWNGDIFNEVRSEAHLADRILSPAGGNEYAAERPLFVVRGNHDVRGLEAELLRKFTDSPNGRYYYQFRQGPVAFVVLDSGEDKEDSHPAYAGLNDFAAYRSEQRVWLQSAIQEPSFRSAPFRVALIHIPLLGNYFGAADSRAKFHDLLVEAKVDLVISGHTHRYAYHPPASGRPYAILIGGGPNLPQATLIQAHADHNTLSVVMQDVEGKKLGDYQYKRQG